MIAVIEVGWNQFIVKKGDTIEVKKQDAQAGDTLSFSALLVSDEKWDNVQVGTPLLSSQVSAKVVDQFKGEKVRVFKMKSKKRFSRNRGFRADLTQLEILDIAA